jgi:hypothetical protein
LTHGTDRPAIQFKNDGAHEGTQVTTAASGDQPGFAPDDDAPIPYMRTTPSPHRGAHYVDVPFQPLKKPLHLSRLTIITTAAPAHQEIARGWRESTS